jgi:GNAT superfamily N-acetyltransferase
LIQAPVASRLDNVKTIPDLPEDEQEEAIRHTGAKSQGEAVVSALSELDRRRRLRNLAARFGTLDGFMSQEELRRMRPNFPSVTILPLAARPEASSWLAALFKAEWPDFFAGRSTEAIEREYFPPAEEGREPPVVLVAEVDGEIRGTVAIRATGPESHPGPWLSGLWVDPAVRNRGIGGELVLAMTAEAWRRGHAELYAATATAPRLFRRLGWEELGDFPYHGVTVAVFRIAEV